jgi:hypothetical protein
MTVCVRKRLKISMFEDPTLDSSLKGLLGNSPLTRHHMMWLTFFRLYFLFLVVDQVSATIVRHSLLRPRCI